MFSLSPLTLKATQQTESREHFQSLTSKLSPFLPLSYLHLNAAHFVCGLISAWIMFFFAFQPPLLRSSVFLFVLLLVFSVFTLQECEPGHSSHSWQRLEYFTRLLRSSCCIGPVSHSRGCLDLCEYGFLWWKSDIPLPPLCLSFLHFCSKNIQRRRPSDSDLFNLVLCSASRPTSRTGTWSLTSMRSIPETSASSPSECCLQDFHKGCKDTQTRVEYSTCTHTICADANTSWTSTQSKVWTHPLNLTSFLSFS